MLMMLLMLLIHHPIISYNNIRFFIRQIVLMHFSDYLYMEEWSRSGYVCMSSLSHDFTERYWGIGAAEFAFSDYL